MANEDIELHVRSGERVPQLEVDAADSTLTFLNELDNEMLEASPERRPTTAAMTARLAAHIRSLSP